MSKNGQPPATSEFSRFDRVITILERARANVACSINSQMGIADWLVGREIVEEEQQGQEHPE